MSDTTRESNTGPPADDERRVFELDPHEDPWKLPADTEAPPPDDPIDPWLSNEGTDRSDASWYPADQIHTETPQKVRRWPLLLGAFAAAFVGGLVAIGALAVFGVFAADEPDVEVAEAPPTTVIERIRTEIIRQEVPAETAEAVAIKVVPSIVTVTVGDSEGGACSTFASGSGVVLHASGQIATNHHVIEDSECQQVIFQDGRIYDAVLLGSDPLTDIAVIEIDADALEPIEFGDSTTLNIGQATVAIGNPLGQAGGASLTLGVLSAVNREVNFGTESPALFGMLQTDAPITQGSSGGALVDIDGRLIGITSAIGVSSSGAEGIGYAIPVELVRRVTEEIIEIGSVKHAFLGITGITHLEEQSDGARAPAGARIESVIDDTTATDLGLVQGDVIIGLDDQEVITMDDLVIRLRLYRAGQSVSFTVSRDGVEFTEIVVLGERPEDIDG